MPTPTAYATQSSSIRPLQGDDVVPGLTWANFIQQFQPIAAGGGTAGGSALSGGAQAIINGLGSVEGRRTDLVSSGNGGEAGSGFGEVLSNDPAYQYMQDVGDGTRNYFTEGANGGIDSVNKTIDGDSWWDSTGLPLVASLAMGAGIGGLASAGVGAADAAGSAGLTAGEYGLDAGLGGQSWTTGLPAAGVPTSFPQADLGYSPVDETGQLLNVAGTDVTPAATTEANSPSFLDMVKNGFQNVSDQWGQVNPLLKTGIGAVGSEGLSALSGGGSDANSVAGLAALDSASAAGGAAPGLTTSYGAAPWYQQPGILGSGGSPVSGGGIVGAVSNLLNGNAGASDYSQLLGAGGSILSGILGSNAASNATNAQVQAANNSNALAAAIYANNTALNQPFVSSGVKSLDEQNNLLGLKGTQAQQDAFTRFTQSPNYQFPLQQGLKAVQNSASAAGGLYSGRAAKDLNNYAQGQASQNYNTYYGDLNGITGIGQASANQQAAQGNSYLNNVTSNNASIGNAQSAGDISGANAITNSLSSLFGQNASNTLLQQLLRNQQGLNGFYSTSGQPIG